MGCSEHSATRIYGTAFIVLQRMLRSPSSLSLLRSNESSRDFIFKYCFTTQQQQQIHKKTHVIDQDYGGKKNCFLCTFLLVLAKML